MKDDKAILTDTDEMVEWMLRKGWIVTVQAPLDQNWMYGDGGLIFNGYRARVEQIHGNAVLEADGKTMEEALVAVYHQLWTITNIKLIRPSKT